MKFGKIGIAGPKGENQDALLEPFRLGGTMWCGIVDGVGSAALGGMAARASIDEVGGMTTVEPMSEMFERVSRKLGALAAEHSSPKPLSTTLSPLAMLGTHALPTIAAMV